MNELNKRTIQRYEQFRILELMASIEDKTRKLFHESFPELQKEYEQEIADHKETRAKIARYRCKLQNLLKGLN